MARANGSYALEAVDVVKTAGANKTVGDVDSVTGGGAILWMTTTASGEDGTVRVKGPIVGTCATGVAFEVGDLVYFNAGVFSKTNTQSPAGFCLADKAAGAGLNEVELYLDPFES